MTRVLRIVVADDEPVMRDYFQRMLPWLGYEVVAAAANGRELVELCHEKKPDLIIADVVCRIWTVMWPYSRFSEMLLFRLFLFPHSASQPGYPMGSARLGGPT